MSTPSFVVPEGLALRQEEGGIIIEHDGDIELHSDLGGSLKRLVSRNGDVVLHAAMSLASVEAGGSFRATRGVRVDSLDASSATIAGDLEAGRVVVRGPLSVEGGLTCEWVEAGPLSCATLTATHLHVNGDAEVSGELTADEVAVGSLQCGGELHVRQLSADGEVAVLGEVDCESLEATGLSTGGDARVGSLSCSGDVNVSGDLTADQVSVDGRLQTDGALSAREVTAGTLAVGGDMSITDRLETAGSLEIGGDVEIAELSARELALGGAVRATRLAATEEIRTTGAVQAERIEAGRVRVEGGQLDVRVVQGRESVTIGAVRVRADVVIAPQVDIDADAFGKISVVEAFNELPPTRIKGCLSVEDLDDLFGNGARFLEERGVEPLRRGSDGEPDLGAEAEDGAAGGLEPADAPAVDELEPEQPDAAAEGDEALETAEPELVEEGDDALVLDVDVNEVVSDDATDHSVAVASSDDGIDGDEDDGDGGDDAGSDDDDGLFDWADQMLTEVVAEDAIHHPDAEPAELLEAEIDSVIAELEDSESLVSELEELEPVEVAPDSAIEPIDDDGDADEDADAGQDAEPIAEDEAAADATDEEDSAAEDDAAADDEEEDPIHGQMQETISRIVSCYVHTEMPPAVTRIKDLVDARDYERIRTDITQIWNQLLKFHQKRGMRIQPQVTTTFNTINSLVRKL